MGLNLFMSLFAMYLLLGEVLAGRLLADTNDFNSNYEVTWGDFNVLSLNGGSEIQLSMDKNCGAGFASKLHYGTGFFHMRIKLPGGNSAGVVTTFYLTSHSENNHDELDFEFLGNVAGKPYVVQTNVFANGVGNRENRIHLWFDPTADFHDYQISWNQHQIVFYVDGVPVRVHKNVGVGFPTQPMQITASLWDGEDWATDGGKTKTDWSHAPFKAYYQGFDVAGCPAQPGPNIPWSCYSNDYWWNQPQFSKLNDEQQRAYENVKQHFTDYDYCEDRGRYPTTPPECY